MLAGPPTGYEGEGGQLGQFASGPTLLGAPATLSRDGNTLIEQSP